VDRAYDVVLFGATGYVGRLSAARLAGKEGLRWAVAGRDRAKLERLADELQARHGARPGIVVADWGDAASLGALAAAGRVVATTVGPYARGGMAVVDACVRERAHYLDLTGEPSFVRESRARYDAAARDAGVKIVHCVGFESVPADLGTLYTVALLPRGIPRVVECWVRARGRISGGTWSSIVAALAPGGTRGRLPRGPGGPLVRSAPFEVGGWGVRVPIIDAEIVEESARIEPERYGEMSFEQRYVLPPAASTVSLVAAVAGTWVVARTEPGRRWLLDRIPSGSGPTPEQRERSWFEITFVGRAASTRVVTRVSGGDPGYGETSNMLVTAAILLATREGDLPQRSGVLTPATALGEPYVDALREAGIRFETWEHSLDIQGESPSGWPR
jgi:short subunit dehydrogenase-like uncharacterized protein